MKIIQRWFVICLKKTEALSALAVRLTKITKKSKIPIHPKHLIDQKPWYLKFLNKNDFLLDLGCHNGQNTIKSAKYVKKAIGVEIDEKSLALATIVVKDLKLENTSFQTGNLENKLQFKNNSFSKVLLLDVLEHINSRKKILGEIHRILKKHGFLIIGVPNSQTSWKKLQRSVGINSYADPGHKIEFSENSIKKILQKTGFQLVHFGYGKYDTPLKGIIDVIGAISLTLYRQITLWRTRKVIISPQEASGFEIVATKL